MSDATSAEGTWQSPGYRSARPRALWVQGLLATTGGLAVIGGFYTWLLATGILDDSVSLSEWNSWSGTVDGVSSFGTAATIGMVIALLLWMHRTVRNAPPLGIGTPATSPGWAVGWWFVPVANFWKPYAILRDLWVRLIGTGHQREWLVSAWWAMWLIAVLGSRLIGAAATSSTLSIDDLQTLFYAAAATNVLAAVSAVAGVLMVREMQNAADLRAQALGLDPIRPPRSIAPTPHQVIAAPSELVGAHSPSATPTEAAPPAAFCHQCGQPGVPGDRFCAACGTKLRHV